MKFFDAPPPMTMVPVLDYKIAVLVFIQNTSGEHLLLLRKKSPNIGTWSPIGGKLEQGLGESPFECAVRETREETGMTITADDLHLFAMIAEKAYEGSAHWLLFLFHCHRPIPSLPPEIAEGTFGFFTREQIDALPLPTTDRQALWDIHDRHRDNFVALRADCHPDHALTLTVEQLTCENKPALNA